jgi:predicted secreted hydrolase
MKSKWFGLFLAAGALAAQDWKIAQPQYRYQFPRDHFNHPDYQTEWWYYTGNLRAPDGHRYGFELTFFRQAQQLIPQMEAESAAWRPDQLYLAHLALTDVNRRTFYHTERLHRAGPGLAGVSNSEGRYWNGNWQVRWTALPGAEQFLIAICERFTLRLKLHPAKPAVIQGKNGISVKGEGKGQASHYISFTRLEGAGTLEQSGVTVPLSGLAWMDHEFFTAPAASDLSGWDWFAIQLQNNEELMLYRLRDKSGRVTRYSSGNYIDAGGSAHFLSARDFVLTPEKTWQSPYSKAQYPVSWHIAVPSLHLNLDERPDLQDQELTSRNGVSPSYWEGAVTYTGTLGSSPIAGVGYLEMTGYQEAVRLGGAARPQLLKESK